MLNETLTQTLLNETAVSGIIVPTIAIIMSGLVAIFSGVVTIFVTFLSIKYNARNLFIQANKEKIYDSIEVLPFSSNFFYFSKQ